MCNVHDKYPELRQFDTSKFKEGKSTLGDADYYCTINTAGKKYIFSYAYVQYDSPNDTFVEIALTTAAIYGENLLLAKDIGIFKKRKYNQLFNEHFINKVKNELQQ